MYVEEEYLKNLLILAGSNSDQSIEESRFFAERHVAHRGTEIVVIQNSDTPQG